MHDKVFRFTQCPLVLDPGKIEIYTNVCRVMGLTVPRKESELERGVISTWSTHENS